MMHIDRLTLRLTGLTSGDAAAVGQRLAERLSEASLEPSRDLNVPLLRQEVAARPGESAYDLADRIAAEILRSIERSV
ncbi:MAG: hypothetical protein ABI759_28555 [Candidatus Solibacter sp.]